MTTTALNSLLTTLQGNQTQITSLQNEITTNQANIQQAETDKVTALRASNQTNAQTAQFTIDSLQQANSDLDAQIQQLQSVQLTPAQLDEAWQTDLIQNTQYTSELALYKMVAYLYEVMCYRAKNKYAEWMGYCGQLSRLSPAPHPSYYAANPGALFLVRGWGMPTQNVPTTDYNGSPVTVDSAAIDNLIQLLGTLKSNGVNGVV